ncbi:MAG: hypothetical protein WAX69_10440, partial [Victivallales bacterium]
GHPVELESVGPSGSKDWMDDPDKLMQGILEIRPRYLNWFGDVFGVLNTIEKRNEQSPQNWGSWFLFVSRAEKAGKNPNELARQYSDFFKQLDRVRIRTADGK